MLGGIVATMAFNAVDTYFVGRLGVAELAAMSFTFPVVMLLTSAAIGLGAGTSSVIARALAPGGSERVRRLTTDALLLAGVVACALAAVGALLIDPVFRLLGATEDLLPLIRDYMELWYLSAPLYIVPIVGMGAIRATGETRGPMWIMIAAAVLNGLLDPLFIFGWGPVPALGLTGAAVALAIARLLILVLTLQMLWRQLDMIDWHLHRPAVIARSWSSILHVGLPAAGTNMIIPLCTAIATAMLAAFGTDVVAGFGVASRVESLALVAFYALSAIIGPMLGQNQTAGRFDRMHEALTVSMQFCVVAGLALAALLWFLGAQAAALFNDDARIVEVAARYFLLVPISYGAAGVVMTVNAGFNGIGEPMPAVVVSLARMGFLFLPLAWVASWWLGYTGIFAAYSCANLICGLGGYWWLRQRIRRAEAGSRK